MYVTCNYELLNLNKIWLSESPLLSFEWSKSNFIVKCANKAYLKSLNLDPVATSLLELKKNAVAHKLLWNILQNRGYSVRDSNGYFGWKKCQSINGAVLLRNGRIWSSPTHTICPTSHIMWLCFTIFNTLRLNMRSSNSANIRIKIDS